MRLAGAVLTGGASRRMGRDKATLAVGGRPMARIVADALADVGCSPVVAVGGGDVVAAGVGLPVVPDGRQGIGPLGGVLGALAWADEAGCTHVLVAACDLPMLSGATLAPLVEAAQRHPDLDVVVGATVAGVAGVAGVDGSRLEPAIGVWRVGARHGLEVTADGGVRALHVAIEERSHLAVELEAAALHNVNLAEDLPGALPARSTARYPKPS